MTVCPHFVLDQTTIYLLIAGRGFHVDSWNHAFSSAKAQSKLPSPVNDATTPRQESPERSIGLSYQMAAGEIRRHSSAGAGILHRRPHTNPANETRVFLRVEPLAHFTLWINLDDPASFLHVLLVSSTPNLSIRPTIALDIVPQNLLLKSLSHWVPVYPSRNGPDHGSNLALESELNASKP